VIVHNLYVCKTLSNIVPSETYAPLIIDSNTELTFPVSSKFFNAIARYAREVVHCFERLHPIQLQPTTAVYVFVCPNTMPVTEVFRLLIAI